jgi:uncharacterized protein (DUF1778 family)
VVKKTPTSSPARMAQNKRIAAIYFLTDEELSLVKRAAKKRKKSFTAFVREAALREARSKALAA